MALICPEVNHMNSEEFDGNSVILRRKVTDIVMKPLLRHFRGQHGLKTVVRSNFRPEMTEK